MSAEIEQQFLRVATALRARDAFVHRLNERSGGKIWERMDRPTGERFVYESAGWLSGPLAKRLQQVNLLLDTGLLGDKSPYSSLQQIQMRLAINTVNALNIAWMERDDHRAELTAAALEHSVFHNINIGDKQYSGLEEYINATDCLGDLARIVNDILTERKNYIKNIDKYTTEEKYYFGFRNPMYALALRCAAGDKLPDLIKYLNTVYTPTVDIITRLSRRLPRWKRKHYVVDKDTGKQVEVIGGMEAFRREGPCGNQVLIASAGSRLLGHGEALLWSNEALAEVRAAVAQNCGPINDWQRFEALVRQEMVRRGILMPQEPDVSCDPAGIMDGKALLYNAFGGAAAVFKDMSVFAYNRPHDPRTWVRALKSIFGKTQFFLNLEDTRFPQILWIERLIRKVFPELPILLDDRGGTVDITLSGLEAAAVKTGRKTREDIESGGKTLSGITFLVAGSGTAGGELIEKLAARGARIICTDSEGGLNRVRLERELRSGDTVRANKAKEKLTLLNITGVEEALEGEDLRDIVLRLEQEERAIGGFIDLSGDPKLGQRHPITGVGYESSTAVFLADHMARNPILFALTNPASGVNVTEFAKRIKELSKADLIDEQNPSRGVRLAIATGTGGPIGDAELAVWYGQLVWDMINNNFIFPIEARICLDACCALTDEIRNAVVRSYALTAIGRGCLTPDLWNPAHLAAAVRDGILAARKAGQARMILDHTGQVRWLRTIEESMQIVIDSLDHFKMMSGHPEIREQIRKYMDAMGLTAWRELKQDETR